MEGNYTEVIFLTMSVFAFLFVITTYRENKKYFWNNYSLSSIDVFILEFKTLINSC